MSDSAELFDLESFLTSSSKTKDPEKNTPDNALLHHELSKLLPLYVTRDQMSSILSKRFERIFYLPEFKQYIYQYALKKLLNLLPGKQVYQQYERYIGRIEKRVYHCVLLHSESVYLGDRLPSGAKESLAALRHWMTLSETQQRDVCRHIVGQTNMDPPTFIDFRFLYGDDAARESAFEDSDGEHYHYEEYSGFSLCRFYLQRSPDYAPPKKQLTMEEVALACVAHIAEKDPKLQLSDQEAAKQTLVYIQAALQRKIDRNENRVHKLISGLTLTVLLKRLRDGIGRGYPAPVPDKRYRLNNVEFPPFLHDVLLKDLLDKTHIAYILAGKPNEQRMRFKLCLSVLRSESFFGESALKTALKGKYTPPFILERDSFYRNAIQHILSQSVLSDQELKTLNTPDVKRLKRIKGLSLNDLNMLKNLGEKRLYHLISLTEPQELSAFINENGFFSTLYLLAQDCGVQKSKIRHLIQAIYQRYLPDTSVTGRDRDNVVHDILLTYEKHLMCFLSKWEPTPRHHTFINKVFNLLISQMGGAQGNRHKAFSNWSILHEVAEKRELLARLEFTNLDTLFHHAKRDPLIESTVKKMLSQFSFRACTEDELLCYATNTVGIKSFHSYLDRVKSSGAMPTPATSALTERLQETSGSLIFDILPAEDLLGTLGVGVSGVCISHNSPIHHQQRTPAAMNIVVRNEHSIMLWGLLVRVQKHDKPAYLLNNLQGALPSRFAKHKTQIRDMIRSLLIRVGDIYTRDFHFNAISLLDENEKVACDPGSLILPKMRLDVTCHEMDIDPNASEDAPAYMRVDKEDVYLLRGVTEM